MPFGGVQWYIYITASKHHPARAVLESDTAHADHFSRRTLKMFRLSRTLYGCLAIFLCLLLLPDQATAQLPDFSGKWAFNASKSELPTGGGGARPGGQMRTPSDLTITQEENVINITQMVPTREGEQEWTQTLTVDGESHETQDQRGNPAPTTATWKDGKLVVEQTMTFSRGGGEPMTRTTTWTYSLQEDGKVLVRETQMRGRGGGEAMTIKYAYDKKE